MTYIKIIELVLVTVLIELMLPVHMGSIGYCNRGKFQLLTDKNLALPNGIQHRVENGQVKLYVSLVKTPGIRVFTHDDDKLTLQK